MEGDNGRMTPKEKAMLMFKSSMSLYKKDLTEAEHINVSLGYALDLLAEELTKKHIDDIGCHSRVGIPLVVIENFVDMKKEWLKK